MDINVDISPCKTGLLVHDRLRNKRYPVYLAGPAKVFSIYNYRSLRERSCVIGFFGARGSGKSVGATRTVIIDYMLRQKTVWSNMEIAFNYIANGKSKVFRSNNLDKLDLINLDQEYFDGLIYIDEVNLLADSRRSMSNANLMMGYVIQQLRKRQLNVIYSAQSPRHVDRRLYEDQTDIGIVCDDFSMISPKYKLGEWSRWAANDLSGVVTGFIDNNNDPNSSVFYRSRECNKPWWNCYSTWQIQEVGAGDSEEAEEDYEVTEICNAINQMFIENDTDRIPTDVIKGKFKLSSRMSLSRKVNTMLLEAFGIGYDAPRRYLVKHEELVMA